ncbi:MAG: cytochrome b [Caulobacterales bacterium]
MQLGNSKSRYGWAAIALHWIVAAGVIAMLWIGLSADQEGISRAERGELMGLHFSVGFFVLLAVLIRTYWSLSQPKPEPLPQPKVLDVVSRVVHYALLAAVFLLVVSGPLAVWSGGRAISVFDLFAVPTPFAERNESVHEAAEVVHGIGRYMIYVALPLHLLGVIKHLVIDRDRTLQRMLYVKSDA